tara:strand:- start:13697 stop:14296 length:600 start_codon:yes stop_codon:yes gene_type:complete
MEDPLKELEDLKNLIIQLNEENSGNELDYEDILKNLSSDENTPNTFNSDSLKIITKFTNKSNNADPEYAKIGDSGFDMRAFLDSPITLNSLERKLIPTGLRFELSSNTELQVRPRSGMALKHGISVLNTPGTVDEGYRGEVGIIVVNLSNDPYTINPGERIAQGVIINVIGQNISNLVKTENLNETERGTGGFGSTGKE